MTDALSETRKANLDWHIKCWEHTFERLPWGLSAPVRATVAALLVIAARLEDVEDAIDRNGP